MPPAYAGGKRQCDLQVFDISGVDLIERAVTGAGVVLCRHRPLAVVGLVLNLPENGRNKEHAEQQVKALGCKSHVLVFVCRRTLDTARSLVRLPIFYSLEVE